MPERTCKHCHQDHHVEIDTVKKHHETALGLVSAFDKAISDHFKSRRPGRVSVRDIALYRAAGYHIDDEGEVISDVV